MSNDERRYNPVLAEHECRERLEKNSDDLEALENLAFALGAQGRGDEAIPALERCVELEPNNPKTRTNLGICYFEGWLYEQALEQFEAANEIDPSLSTPYAYMAKCYMVKEPAEPYAAIRVLDQGLENELSRKDSELWELRAELVDGEGFAENERAFFDEAVELFPNNVEILIYAGSCYAECQDLPAAKKAYDAAVSLFPEDHNVFINYARMLADAGAFDEAMPYAEKAESLYDDFLKHDVVSLPSPDAHLTKAYILMHLGHLQHAQSSIERAVEIMGIAEDQIEEFGHEAFGVTEEHEAILSGMVDSLKFQIEQALNDEQAGFEPSPWDDQDNDGGDLAPV